MQVALLAGLLSEGSGGLAASVPGMAKAIEDLGGARVQVIGTLDRQARTAWRGWARNVQALEAYGPSAFHWTPGLYSRLIEFAPDIVDVQGLWMYQSLINRRMHRRLHHRYVVTPRGMLDPWALRYSAWKKRLVSLWFERENLREAACVRATAPMEANHLRAYGLRQPIAVVPNGVDLPDIQRTADPQGGKRLLFLSRIHPKKGIPFLLKAWSAVQDRHPEWQLVIAGPEEIGHARAMATLAEDLGAKRVSWPGPVYGAEKQGLFRSADVFVLPTHGENFGLVVAEALAHAVPVITTRFAPWSGLADRGCGWWIELDHGVLVDTLDEAMRLSDGQRRSMGDRGRAWVERDFGWASVGSTMLEVYNWVLGGGAAPACVRLD